MPTNLPDVISRYFERDADRDIDSIVDLFADDATVVDEGEERHGTAEIRAWQTGAASKYTYTTEITSAEALGPDHYVVSGRLTGNFPGGTGRAAARAAVAEEVGEELVEEAPATERRPPRPATLTLKLPKVLFADGDRPLLAVLPDPHGCDGGPTPVDLAHRGRHENLLAAGASAREGLAHGGARLGEETRPRKCAPLSGR